jgi:hypothetical protein
LFFSFFSFFSPSSVFRLPLLELNTHYERAGTEGKEKKERERSGNSP